VLQLDFSVVNVALPAILRDLRMPPAQLQWIVTGYALTYGALLLVGGRAADMLGRRRVFIAGLTFFAIASIVCGLASSPLLLIAARMAQGLAAAATSPAALSLLTTSTKEGAERTRALGIWQAMTAAGAMTGIIVGGVLTEYLGWRSIFLVNPPIVFVMLLMARRLLPNQPAAAGSSHLDVRGALLLTAAVGTFILGLSTGEQDGFGAVSTIVALAAAIIFAAWFVVAERGIAEPMVPREISSSRPRQAAVAVMLLMGAVIAGYVYFVSLYLQRVLEFSPALAGLGLVPSTVTVVLSSTYLMRRVLAKIGVWPTILTGLTFMALGQLWLTNVWWTGSYAQVILPGLLLTAFGMGLALPAASVALTNGVAPQNAGLAGSLFVASQQIGGAAGLAILATIAAARTSEISASLQAGYGAAFLVSTVLIVIALGVALTQVRRSGGAQCRSSMAS
jgi:EmrB/QacA subfamily drug resistance transporter